MRLRLASILMLPAAWASASVPAHAQAQASEQAVKAAFLPKFARYIEFSDGAQPSAGQPYYLCVIGRDPFGTLLDKAAASEAIEGHNVAIRRFANADPEAVAGCHIAYVAGPNDAATQGMLARVERHVTLTVTDARFGRSRGMVHFALVAGRVRFHIDNGSAARAGISVSSRLLALAVEVKP